MRFVTTFKRAFTFRFGDEDAPRASPQAKFVSDTIFEGGVVAKDEARYPERLRPLAGAPPRLYYRGRWEDALFAQCLAVVGSRRMTRYGTQVTEALVAPIAAAGVTIVSGFMFGIDAAAHRAALAAGGRTIAVMPCGIERIHPAHQETLYGEILRRGLVLSELPGMSAAALWTFPKRNRIVAGLSQATLVIEGTEESGALITAACARRYGRRVFAVPGPVTSPVSLGPIQLLREGAAVAARAEDVLAYYGKRPPLQRGQTPFSEKGLTLLERRILRRLGQGAAEIDALARALQLSPAAVGTALSLLQLRGQIVEADGRYALGLQGGRGG